jgi:MoaA/NifB/PqqE/SkfB family radical SAM enzyme
MSGDHEIMNFRNIRSQSRFGMKRLRERFLGHCSVRIDASSVCQLHCPICPTAKGSNRNGVIGWGFLKFDNFKKIIEDNPGIRKVELSNWGEIFLNPQIREIMRFAQEKKIELSASNGSNFNTVDEETIESLVRYGFSFLSISLDGASRETYQIYRRGGNFETVIGNIKKINHYKKKYHTDLPRLRWQFVVFGHNEHDIKSARQKAEELGMEFYPKLNYDQDYSPVQDTEAVRKASGLKYVSREEFRQKKNREYAVPCKQVFFSPQINWDGRLLGCCMNVWSDFGNVFETGFESCLKSERYVYTKKLLMGKAGAREDIPCTNCSIFLSAKAPVTDMF